jgi:hypothetical protein
LLVHPDRNLIFLEIRDEAKKQVSFSLIDLDSRTPLFEYLTLEEPWWISMAEISGKFLLLKVYTDTHNPDKKSLIAFDFEEQQIAWWRNNFAISEVRSGFVFGSETNAGMNFLVLGLSDGQPVLDQPVSVEKQNFPVVKPLQYHQESSHFETVRSFLNLKYQISPQTIIEYAEFGHLMIISCYIEENGLANYLIVINESGETLLNERIGEHLKGIGSDTFFLVSGYLIFVKNRSVLVSYKIV